MSKLTYKKHYCKRDPQTSEIMLNNDKAPIKGEFIRNTRITESLAEELNAQWKGSGYIWVKAEEEKKESKKSEERLLLEKEAQELGIKFRETIGDEKLKDKINEKKGE